MCEEHTCKWLVLRLLIFLESSVGKQVVEFIINCFINLHRMNQYSLNYSILTCSFSSISSFARGYLFRKMLWVASRSRRISRGERSGLCVCVCVCACMRACECVCALKCRQRRKCSLIHILHSLRVRVCTCVGCSKS